MDGSAWHFSSESKRTVNETNFAPVINAGGEFYHGKGVLCEKMTKFAMLNHDSEHGGTDTPSPRPRHAKTEIRRCREQNA